MRKILVLLAIVAMGILGPAVTLAQSAPKTVVNAGLDVDPGTMDPRLTQDTSALRMQELIFNGLVRLDQKLQVVPDLALSWSYSSPTELVMKLRPNVVFQDGEPFTADDVVYTYDTILDPKFNSPRRSLYTPITKVEAVDPLTVRFTLSEPYAPLLKYMTIGIVPKDAASKLGTDFGTHPVGTGPFKFVSWQRGSTITLAANDTYFRGKPHIDQLVIHIIPDNNVRLQALESGELQLIHSPVPPQSVASLAKNPRFVVTKMNALGFTYLNLNLKDPILADKRVRQALAYLSDTKTIAQDIFFGMDTPGQSFLIPGTASYSDNVTTYSYNPAKAAQLLTEAGWVAKSPGAIRQKDGKPLTVQLITNVDPNRQQIIEFLQQAWRQAGIDAKVQVLDFATELSDLQAGKYQISLIGLLNVVDPDYPVYTFFKTGGQNNWGSYSNPEVDKLADEGRTTTDEAKRKEIYQQAAKIITDDAPAIYLLYQGYVVIHDKNLQGFVAYPSGSWTSLESATYTPAK